MNFFKKYFYPLVFSGLTAAGAYYAFELAEDRYVSHSSYTLKSQSEGVGSGMDFGFLAAATPGKQDQLIIKDFLLSEDMMTMVLDAFDIAALSSSDRDPFWHVTVNTDPRKQLNHYRKLVEVRYNEDAGLTELNVDAFDPAVARELNEFLIGKAEQYINDYSTRTNKAFVDHARKEVQIAKDRLIALSEEIEQQQQATGVLNPETDVKVIVSTLSALEQDLAATQAELDEKRGYMQEDSLQISSLKRSVDHLTDQISAQRSKLAGRDTQKETLAEISTSIALLEREMEFAAQALQGSLTTLEAAKLKAMQSRKNLVVIDHANENPIAEKPERVMTFLMILLVNILLTIGVRAISRIIKEG